MSDGSYFKSANLFQSRIPNICHADQILLGIELSRLNRKRDKFHFLGVFGIYVLTARIFDYLEENIKQNAREKGEFQLTSCLDKLQKA